MGRSSRQPPRLRNGRTATHLTGCRKKLFGCHSERSEESLPIQNRRLRGILRAKSALRMTVLRFFFRIVSKTGLNLRFSRGGWFFIEFSSVVDEIDVDRSFGHGAEKIQTPTLPTFDVEVLK